MSTGGSAPWKRCSFSVNCDSFFLFLFGLFIVFVFEKKDEEKHEIESYPARSSAACNPTTRTTTAASCGACSNIVWRQRLCGGLLTKRAPLTAPLQGLVLLSLSAYIFVLKLDESVFFKTAVLLHQMAFRFKLLGLLAVTNVAIVVISIIAAATLGAQAEGKFQLSFNITASVLW